MSKFSAKKSALRLLSCILAFCMCITMFANTIGFFAVAETAETVTVWDGTDDYTSLDDVLTDLGAADSDGYYHITTANQLHAVIRLGGGGNSYKLDNDLYLNSDWENYQSWTNSNPAPNDWGLNGSGYSFSGTIDGDNHAIYGYYNNASAGNKNYVGLIPVVNWNAGDTQSVTIKNLDMLYCSQNGNTASGFFIGATHWQGSGSVTIEGCSVRHGFLNLLWNDNLAGGFVGRVAGNTPVTINNCAVGDIIFDAQGDGSGYSGYSTYGSFVGSTYANTNADYTFNAGQAKTVQIYNSYAYNCINAKTNEPVYVCGIYRENATTQTYSYCVTASNVYTDATEIPTNNGGTVTLLVSADGLTAVDPTSEDFPIHTITADSIKGEAAKTAMPLLNWNCWQTIENDYPIYRELEVWDGTDDYTSLDDVLADLGAVDSEGYYHITTANQLHAVIKYNGGGNKYKLDNDLYLNSDYENSANWTFSNAPANEWSFVSESWTSPTYKFYGTIDGCGHTVYGLYSNDDNAYNGLIGTVYDTTVIKNLNVWHSFIRNAYYSSGIIIGGNFYNSPTTATITVEGCSVRYATIDNVWENSPSGGIIGMTTRATTINNCSVSDVKFTSGIPAADIASKVNAFGAMGSFVGGLYASTSADTSVYNQSQARNIVIKNSYAVNVVNEDNNNAPVYVCGIYREGTSSNWTFSITANNVYTDSTEVSANNAGTVKLLVSADGLTAIDSADENYPIKTVTADAIIGDGAKTEMPLLNWSCWQTVTNDYPVYSELEIWDGTDNYASLDEVLAELSVDTDNYYHITTANQLHAVIRLGGGDNKYKLDNDLYLNGDWENYQSWTNSNPAPNDWGLNGTGYSFSGTIDGDNHAIYGYYNNASAGNKNYVGLIPVVNWNSGETESVTIKNLDMLYCSQNGNIASGFFIGATHWQGSGTVTIENCTVKKGFLNLIWNDNLAGAFVGKVAGNTPVTISNCAAEDIIFDARGDGSGYSGYSTLGSFVGSTYSNMDATYAFNAGQAKAVKIYNSYAYNCINSKTNKPVYICGIFREGTDATTGLYKYSYCVTAKNVYTDATEIPTNNDGTVKLLVSEDGATENNTIKVPTADNYAGLFENGAWYMGAFGDNSPILKSRTADFAYLDITGEGIEDKYSTTDMVYLRKHLLGVDEYAYILGNVNCDEAVNIIDLVKIKKILSGK